MRVVWIVEILSATKKWEPVDFSFLRKHSRETLKMLKESRDGQAYRISKYFGCCPVCEFEAIK